MNSSTKIKSNEINYPYRLNRHSKRSNSIRNREEEKFFDGDNILYVVEIGVKPEIFKENFCIIHLH